MLNMTCDHRREAWMRGSRASIGRHPLLHAIVLDQTPIKPYYLLWGETKVSHLEKYNLASESHARE